jgi:hypothetical protein
MPRQHILKHYDPDGTKSVEEVRASLDHAMREYCNIVIENKEADGLSVLEVLDIYETFHMLSRATTWAPVPISCTCPECAKDCICSHGTLLASVFDRSLKVPDEYVAAEPSMRKKTKLLKGTAGPKRLRIRQEIAEEKKKADSKTKFLDHARAKLIEESSEDEVSVYSCMLCHPSHRRVIRQDLVRPVGKGKGKAQAKAKASSGGSQVTMFFSIIRSLGL